MPEPVCPVWAGYTLAQTQGFALTGHALTHLPHTATLVKPPQGK